jgi:Domain of unknown function (DUF6570)
MNLDEDEVCAACNKDKQDPPLFSDTNYMNPGPIPIHLPALSEVEEMLIARVHVHQQIARVRGHQYQYTGHVVCFAQNTLKFLFFFRKLGYSLV